MSRLQLGTLTLLALLAFAGNSVLCRLALSQTSIDAGTFTSLRLAAGAATLWWLLRLRRGNHTPAGNYPSALALFAYAAGFSFAYRQLGTATGALLLFGAVQTTMIGYGLLRGERLAPAQLAGFALACSGLAGLLLPGLSAPPLASAVLMLGAGVAWGAYSLFGKGSTDPLAVTAGNFARTLPFTLLLSLACLGSAHWDNTGAGYAVLSGALTSGVGYAIWYAVLPSLPATTAATLQLSVPVIAALGGVLWLHESVSLRLMLASAAILGGIALVIRHGRRP